MRRVLAIVILIIGASIVSGQTTETVAKDKANCTLTIGLAPEIKGLRLGMTVEQALALFPGSSSEGAIRSELAAAPGKLGVANIFITPANYKTKSEFTGILRIMSKFIDGRMSSMRVTYNGPKWEHVDEFVTKFAEGTNLPAADAWEAYVGMDTQLKTLRCNGFEISIFAGGTGGNLNYVQMNDTVAEQKLKERREKARQKAAQESKP